MDDSPYKIPLVRLSPELAAYTKLPPIPYRTFYSLVIDGKLPATRERSGWFVNRADLPAIARILAPVTAPSAKPRARKAAAGHLATAAI